MPTPVGVISYRCPFTSVLLDFSSDLNVRPQTRPETEGSNFSVQACLFYRLNVFIVPSRHVPINNDFVAAIV